MTEKCMYCDRDALVKSDHDTMCAECYMRREVENAKTHIPRSRTFTSSKAGGRTLSPSLSSHRYKTP